MSRTQSTFHSTQLRQSCPVTTKDQRWWVVACVRLLFVALRLYTSVKLAIMLFYARVVTETVEYDVGLHY